METSQINLAAVSFEVIEAYARFRLLGLTDGLEIIQQKQELWAQFIALMQHSVSQDNKVIQDHLAAGGRWCILAENYHQVQERLVLAKIDLKSLERARFIIPVTPTDYHKALGLVRSGTKLLVTATVRPQLYDENILRGMIGQDAAYSHKFTMPDFIKFALARFDGIIIENWVL